MASVAEQVQQLKREMAEKRRERAESLQRIRSDVQAIGGTVGTMLNQFSEARTQDAQTSRQKRREHMNAVRAEAQSITGGVADLLEQFHSERAAATQAESDARRASVDEVRVRVRALLSEARDARSEARTQDKAQRQAAMRQIADEVAQLIEASRSARGHLVDAIRADTERVLEEARAEQSERRAVMQALHNAWTRTEDSPNASAPPPAEEVYDAAPSEEEPTPDKADDKSSKEAVVTDAAETAVETAPEDTAQTQDAGEAQDASATQPTQQESTQPTQGPDDFSVLQGVGAKIADRLHEAGFTTFADLANTTPSEIRNRIDELPPFVNTMAWIEQAAERTQ